MILCDLCTAKQEKVKNVQKEIEGKKYTTSVPKMLETVGGKTEGERQDDKGT